jgi:hypothetical protein
MIFLYPSVLFFLLALAIPIIIHLFNFRRYKKIYFSNVAFLKNIQTESEKKSKLKHLLVLLSRLLAFAALIVAFSQPYIPTGKEETKSDITIYIDNSLSTEAKNDNGTLLEQAKNLAIEIINNYDNSTRFTLITNDFFGKHTHTFSKTQAKNEVDLITVSPLSKEFAQVYNRWQQLATNSKLFIVSDFQKNINLDFTVVENENDISLFSLKPNTNNNIFIDTVWFASPNHNKFSKEHVFASVVNTSDNEQEVRIELELNGSVKAFSNVSILENQSTIVEFSFDNDGLENYVYGKLSLSDYASPTLVFDDDFYFAYEISKQTAVGIIQEQNNTSALLENVYKTDSSYTTIKQWSTSIDFDALGKSQLIILNELEIVSTGLQSQLEVFLEQGKTIVVIPPVKLDASSYQLLFSKLATPPYRMSDTSFLRTRELPFKHPFFANMFKEETSKMDLPKIGFRHPLSSATNSIIQFENNDAFLAAAPSQKGDVFVFSFPFSHPKNNFKSHALFVPIMLRIAELSGNKSQPYHYLNAPIEFSIQQEISMLNGLTVESMDKKLNFIPKSSNTQGKTSITIHDEIERAGFYNVRYENNVVKPLAINHNRTESVLNYYTDKDLSLLISSAKSNAIKLFEINNTSSVAEIISKEKGKTLWWYFIFAALLFFFIEILLIRFLK